MSIRVDTTSLISGALVVGDRGLGVLGSEIPSTGDSGAGYLYNDLSLPTDATKEVRGLITSQPSAGTLYAYEDSSFTFTGAPDGVYSFTYQLYIDGTATGAPATATLTVGGEVATLTIIEHVDLFSGSAQGNGEVLTDNTYGGGGGAGGNKGWSRVEWSKKKAFEEQIGASLKEALTPAERIELAQEAAPAASPAKLRKFTETLTPKAAKPLALAPPKSLAVVEPDEDEERSVELLLEEDYAGLHLLLPLVQKALRSL